MGHKKHALIFFSQIFSTFFNHEEVQGRHEFNTKKFPFDQCINRQHNFLKYSYKELSDPRGHQIALQNSDYLEKGSENNFSGTKDCRKSSFFDFCETNKNNQEYPGRPFSNCINFKNNFHFDAIHPAFSNFCEDQNEMKASDHPKLTIYFEKNLHDPNENKTNVEKCSNSPSLSFLQDVSIDHLNSKTIEEDLTSLIKKQNYIDTQLCKSKLPSFANTFPEKANLIHKRLLIREKSESIQHSEHDLQTNTYYDPIDSLSEPENSEGIEKYVSQVSLNSDLQTNNTKKSNYSELQFHTQIPEQTTMCSWDFLPTNLSFDSNQQDFLDVQTYSEAQSLEYLNSKENNHCYNSTHFYSNYQIIQDKQTLEAQKVDNGIILESDTPKNYVSDALTESYSYFPTLTSTTYDCSQNNSTERHHSAEITKPFADPIKKATNTLYSTQSIQTFYFLNENQEYAHFTNEENLYKLPENADFLLSKIIIEKDNQFVVPELGVFSFSEFLKFFYQQYSDPRISIINKRKQFSPQKIIHFFRKSGKSINEIIQICDFYPSFDFIKWLLEIHHNIFTFLIKNTNLKIIKDFLKCIADVGDSFLNKEDIKKIDHKNSKFICFNSKNFILSRRAIFQKFKNLQESNKEIYKFVNYPSMKIVLDIFNFQNRIFYIRETISKFKTKTSAYNTKETVYFELNNIEKNIKKFDSQMIEHILLNLRYIMENMMPELLPVDKSADPSNFDLDLVVFAWCQLASQLYHSFMLIITQQQQKNKKHDFQKNKKGDFQKLIMQTIKKMLIPEIFFKSIFKDMENIQGISEKFQNELILYLLKFRLNNKNHSKFLNLCYRKFTCFLKRYLITCGIACFIRIRNLFQVTDEEFFVFLDNFYDYLILTRGIREDSTQFQKSLFRKNLDPKFLENLRIF